MPSPNETAMMDTVSLRETFLLDQLFAPGELVRIYADMDRVIVGSAVPVAAPLTLDADEEMRSAYL